MKKMNTIFMVLVGVIIFHGCSNTPTKPINIGFWNVENLFDLVDDPGINDEEFTPNGRKHVTKETLELKLTHMSEVLSDLNADALGLAEVENDDVLNQLNDTYTGRNYKWIHYDSPDERGIDVAFLYDPSVLKVTSSEPISITLADKNDRTRDILHVKARWKYHTIHFFVNHWPSNYGGMEQAIPKRAKIASVLREHILTILKKNPDAEILLMGDFNEGPMDKEVHDVLGATAKGSDPETQLVDLMDPFLDKAGAGTYVWHGKDEILDQMIVSQGLLDKSGLSIVPGSMSINDKPKYRQQEGDYKHYPFRFWVGDKLLGGYSDHLAISVELEMH